LGLIPQNYVWLCLDGIKVLPKAGSYVFSLAVLRACAVSAGLPARNAYGIAVAGGRPQFYRKKI